MSTHVAFTDESSHDKGKYRAVTTITLKRRDNERIKRGLSELLKESNVSEFKWTELRSARLRHAANKIINFAIKAVLEKSIRIDSLIWDIDDSRHKISGRDDTANLCRMYHHLLRNVFLERWPKDSTWTLFPDEQGAISWDEVQSFLMLKSVRRSGQPDFFDMQEGMKSFGVKEICPQRSHESPIVQMADLFGGMAVYSRKSYNIYECWEKSLGYSHHLFETTIPQIKDADKERCTVLKLFNTACKQHKLGVSLERYRGLRTLLVGRPVNFWWYEPQHEKDKAPLRKQRYER